MTEPSQGAADVPRGPGRHVVQSVAVTATVMAVGLVSGIIAARSLGVDGRGQLAAVILWPAVLASVAELGLPTAFTYLTASRGLSSRDLARDVVPLVALQSCLLYIVGVPVILAVLAGYSTSVRASAIGFLVIYGPLYLFVRYLCALNLGEGRIGVYNLARILIAVVYAGVLVILLLLDVVGVRAFAEGYAASWVATLVVLLVLSSREIRSGMFRPHVDLGTARMAWAVGYRTYFGTLAPVDSLQLDVLLTTALLGPTEAGLYFVATSAGAVVRTWGTTLGALSLPRVAASATNEDALAVMSLYVRTTMVLSGLFAGALFVFAGPLLSLVYGAEYVQAEILVRILVVGMLAASLRYVLGDGLRGMGRHARATQAEMLGWLVGGATLLVLLPLWGVNGVAVAVSASYLTTLVVMLGYSARLGVRPARLLVPTLNDVSNGGAVIRSALRGGRGYEGHDPSSGRRQSPRS